MPHRMQLTVGKALEDTKTYLNNVPPYLNKIYSFYTSSHKRINSLRLQKKVLVVEGVVLTYIQKIRWVASEFGTIKKNTRFYELLATNLEAIAADPKNFKDKTLLAPGLLKKLQTLMFLASLYFLMDVFEAITQFSVTMQASAGVLIGKETARQNLFDYINGLLENIVSYIYNY